MFYGFVFALSSTAIVLRALAERRELDAPHGRFIVGTLIFQDLCVVPMVLIVPLLGRRWPGQRGRRQHRAGAWARRRWWSWRWSSWRASSCRKVLAWVDASRSREVFLLAILALCIGTAWLTSLVGLSLALGAFLGGMVVADTEYSHRAMGDILPLRDAFVSVFFVSLGMLFDVRVVATQPLLVVGLLLGFLLAKGLLATLAAMAMRFPSRVAWLAGVGLAQFGEFGFVLARLGQDHGVVDDAAMGPLLGRRYRQHVPDAAAGARGAAHHGRRAAAGAARAADRRAQHRRGGRHRSEHSTLSGHVVIVGFGVAGQVRGRHAAAQQSARSSCWS